MSQYLRQEFLSIALSSLTKNLTLNESQYSDFQYVLINMIENMDLSNVNVDEAKARFKLVINRASNKGNVYIGIYIAYILTHDAMQGGLNTFHNLGSTDIAKSNLQLQLSDITQFRKTKFANTIVPVKFNKFINIYHATMIAETFVGIFMSDLVDQLEINPKIDTTIEYKYWRNKQWNEISGQEVILTTSKKLSLGISLDPRRMKELNIKFSHVIDKLSRHSFVSTKSLTGKRKKRDLNSAFISEEKNLIYLVSGGDISKPDESRKKLSELRNLPNRLLLRGHKNIQDLFINYDEKQALMSYDSYTDIPEDEISYAFLINNDKALKFITTHPLVEEVITVRHGGLYDKCYGIIQTSNFIMRNKKLFKYQDLFVSILAQLLTLSGKLNSVIDSIKFNEDVLSSSFKGRSMETLVEYAAKGTEPRKLGNVAYFSIFGNLLHEREPSTNFQYIHNKLFGDIVDERDTIQVSAKLFAEYEYDL